MFDFILVYSYGSSLCWTWDIASIIALCSHGGDVHTVAPFAASLLNHIHLLRPHSLTLSALNQKPATLPPYGPLIRVPHPLPATAAWAAVIIACGSNTQSSCWRITMTEATGRSQLLKRTSWMRTWKPSWRWRSNSWKRREWCVRFLRLQNKCY